MSGSQLFDGNLKYVVLVGAALAGYFLISKIMDFYTANDHRSTPDQVDERDQTLLPPEPGFTPKDDDVDALRKRQDREYEEWKKNRG